MSSQVASPLPTAQWASWPVKTTEAVSVGQTCPGDATIHHSSFFWRQFSVAASAGWCFFENLFIAASSRCRLLSLVFSVCLKSLWNLRNCPRRPRPLLIVLLMSLCYPHLPDSESLPFGERTRRECSSSSVITGSRDRRVLS